MSPRIKLPPTLVGRPFLTSEARTVGINIGRLRGPDLIAPFKGVRVERTAASSVEQTALAYAERTSPHAFFSHLTAARIWGIPLPLRLEEMLKVDVAVPAGAFVPVGRGIRSHSLMIAEQDVVGFGRLRVTSRARTWCDLAALLTEEELVAAGDFLIWRRLPSPIRLGCQELADATLRFAGRRGRGRLIFALDHLSDRADSPAESTMRVRCLRAGLPTPQVNKNVYNDFGYFVGMPDLGFADYRTALDYDGDKHRTDKPQWNKDLRRGPRFEDAKWSYLRAGAIDLGDSTEIIALVKSRLRQHGWIG